MSESGLWGRDVGVGNCVISCHFVTFQFLSVLPCPSNPLTRPTWLYPITLDITNLVLLARGDPPTLSPCSNSSTGLWLS